MTEATVSQKLKHIPPDEIKENPENPRLVFRQDEMDSLMVSIAKNGIQVPISLYKEGSHYRLIDGERRWRCARKLNLKTVPALVQDKPSELQNLLLMYNIHALREQWDYFTIASKLGRIIELSSSKGGKPPGEAQLSEVTGLSRGQIRRCQLLLDLPERFKTLLLAELELPKAQQKLSEDFFIEMERSLKAVVKRVPEYKKRLDQVRDTLVTKFRNDTIVAVTDFRQLSKIATAIDRPDVNRDRIKKALDRVFRSGTKDGIRDAYASTVEFVYDERRAARQVAFLNEYFEALLEDGKTLEFDEEFVGQLRVLMRRLQRLLNR